MGGLNKEIQTILEYKEYNNITRLFHLACKLNVKCRIDRYCHELIFCKSIFIMDTACILYFHTFYCTDTSISCYLQP